MALTFSVASVTGKTYDVMVKGEDRVKEPREEVERYIEVPEACYLKLFHGAEVLHDALPLTALYPTEQVFAVVARETKVELLLQAAGSYEGYKELLKMAPSSPEGDHIKVVKGLPSILAVLEDMAGQKPEIEHLRAGEHGLEMSSKDGHLLLPSINSGVLLRESRKEQFSKVVVSVQLNSDAYNKGLGLVVEEPPSMQSLQRLRLVGVQEVQRHQVSSRDAWRAPAHRGRWRFSQLQHGLHPTELDRIREEVPHL